MKTVDVNERTLEQEKQYLKKTSEIVRIEAVCFAIALILLMVMETISSVSDDGIDTSLLFWVKLIFLPFQAVAAIVVSNFVTRLFKEIENGDTPFRYSIADKLKGSGYVEARDKSEDKVMMMQENIDRLGIINMVAALKDATVFDQNSFHRADIVLCDVPCSGLGVIGRKQDIRYRMNPTRQEELVRIQRRILSVAQNYVKPGGVLIYSTCTIGADENQMNLKYFLENFPFRLDSIDPYIPEQLRCRTSEGGYIQLLPGVHETDGFFIARLKRYDE